MEKDLHLVNKLRIRKLTKVIRFPVPPNASPEERRAAAERAYAASAASAMPEDNDWCLAWATKSSKDVGVPKKLEMKSWNHPEAELEKKQRLILYSIFKWHINDI